MGPAPLPRARLHSYRHARGVVLAASACMLALGLATAAYAGSDEPPKESWVYDVARDVMSPFCPGRTIASCPSPQAAELIQEMHEQEKAGATREEVEAALYAQYGDVIRGAPKPEGWGLAAYVIPLLSAVVGVGLVVFVLRRLSSGGASTPAAAAARAPTSPTAPGSRSAEDDEIERLVDRELEQLG